ncbi:MAG: FHA domain-containing protein, partial [Acidimicrobiia bacterium]|nr:FHA domain-containing protein [Acidimicrobiia bacterium]
MRGVALPPVEVEGPGGIPVVVAARSPDDTVGELAAALGVDPEATVVIDGRAVPRATALVAVGFRRGSRVGAALGDIAPSSTAGRPLVIVVCEAGPGATGPVRLGAGRHVIGRAAPVAVRIDDPAVEPHHGVLDVTVDGAVHFTQLTGRVPCRVDGDVVAAGVAHVVRDGGAITIGASRIRIGRAGELDPVTLALAPTPGDPWRWTVRRPPRRHV